MRQLRRTRSEAVVVIALVVAVIAAGGGVLAWRLAVSAGTGGRGPAAVAPAAPAVALRSAGPVRLDRLTIAAMRARPYPASRLTVVREEGEQGGYTNALVSFVSDGLTERALMSTPDGPRPAAGWPVVIINHGYQAPATYRTDDQSYLRFIAAFARAGWLVLKPDYRGHGQSEGVAEGGHLSPVYAYDLLNLISTVGADPRMDGSRIALFGHSMGGHEVLRAMVVSTHVRAAILLAGVVGSFDDLFFHWPHAPTPPGVPSIQYRLGHSEVADHGDPEQNPDFWSAASAIDAVAATTAAVQVDQDVADSQVPRLFSDHLVEALRAAGKTVEYNLYPGDDHQFGANGAAVLAAMLAFLRAHD